MYTTPSPDELIEGVIVSLANDVMPAVTNAKAQATVAMAQAVLQQVRQTLPIYHQYLADEHNGMTRVFREVAALIGEAPGQAADAIRARARTLGARADYPEVVDPAALMAAHKACSQGLVDTLRDLDTLQRAGSTGAGHALATVRGHLGPRYARDAATLIVGAGMVGRG
ncbi:MAG: hypothetical protein HYX53_15090 [Chloroflexi bacterium]|nr:hypothetical protein [Chloroflexota bacterium]